MATSIITEALVAPRRLPGAVASRLRRMGVRVTDAQATHVLERITNPHRKVSLHFAMAVLLTLLSGWATPIRVNDPNGNQGCIFGCPNCSDSVGHYIISCARVGDLL